MKPIIRSSQPFAEYRRRLLDKRSELLSELRSHCEDLIQPRHIAHEDRARILYDEFVTSRINHLGYVQLRMIDNALDRLDSGEYGVCQNCAEPIALKRLMAVPWAAYCIDCQDRRSAGPEEVPTPALEEWAA
jgi:DnaK suppressor protein